MNTSKKTEKKAGIREWFMGKTAKNSKTRLTTLARPDSMPVGPIVERLQKQSAYLSATMQQTPNGRESKSPNRLSPEPDQLNYDEFLHKRHLFQNHSRPTFCDVCDDFVLGIYKSAIRCKCKFNQTKFPFNTLYQIIFFSICYLLILYFFNIRKNDFISV